MSIKMPINIELEISTKNDEKDKVNKFIQFYLIVTVILPIFKFTCPHLSNPSHSHLPNLPHLSSHNSFPPHNSTSKPSVRLLPVQRHQVQPATSPFRNDLLKIALNPIFKSGMCPWRVSRVRKRFKLSHGKIKKYWLISTSTSMTCLEKSHHSPMRSPLNYSLVWLEKEAHHQKYPHLQKHNSPNNLLKWLTITKHNLNRMPHRKPSFPNSNNWLNYNPTTNPSSSSHIAL